MANFYELERDHAVISQCGKYRYALHRRISELSDKACAFVMLNPSTADGLRDDPTIRRCRNFALSWGCGHLFVCNLFAWRATDPKELRRSGVGAGDIVGPDNQDWIEKIADVVTRRSDEGGPIVCAWGPNGRYLKQDDTVVGWLEETYKLHCLGCSKDGSPRHPLMLPKSAQLQRFAP